MRQLELFRPCTEKNFAEFHEQNPDIYKDIVSIARMLRARGMSRFSMKAIFEKLRWDRMVATTSNEKVKLNNNYTSFYVREVERREPDLCGFFEVRKAVADE